MTNLLSVSDLANLSLRLIMYSSSPSCPCNHVSCAAQAIFPQSLIKTKRPFKSVCTKHPAINPAKRPYSPGA